MSTCDRQRGMSAEEGKRAVQLRYATAEADLVVLQCLEALATHYNSEPPRVDAALKVSSMFRVLDVLLREYAPELAQDETYVNELIEVMRNDASTAAVAEEATSIALAGMQEDRPTALSLSQAMGALRVTPSGAAMATGASLDGLGVPSFTMFDAMKIVIQSGPLGRFVAQWLGLGAVIVMQYVRQRERGNRGKMLAFRSVFNAQVLGSLMLLMLDTVIELQAASNLPFGEATYVATMHALPPQSRPVGNRWMMEHPTSQEILAATDVLAGTLGPFNGYLSWTEHEVRQILARKAGIAGGLETDVEYDGTRNTALSSLPRYALREQWNRAGFPGATESSTEQVRLVNEWIRAVQTSTVSAPFGTEYNYYRVLNGLRGNVWILMVLFQLLFVAEAPRFMERVWGYSDESVLEFVNAMRAKETAIRNAIRPTTRAQVNRMPDQLRIEAVAREVVRLAGGRNAEHQKLESIMRSLLLIRTTAKSNNDALTQGQLNTLTAHENATNNMPAPVQASCADGSASVVDALFARHAAR